MKDGGGDEMTSSIRSMVAGGAAAIAVSIATAAGGQTPQTAPPAEQGAERMPQSGRMGMMMEMCPERIPGARTQLEEVPGGIAVEITTERQAEVPELRRRVERLARMHEERHGMHRGMHGGMMMQGRPDEAPSDERQPTAGRAGRPGAGMRGTGPMMSASTRVEEVPSGARLVITTESEADVERLREHVRMHVARMEAHECPMQQMMQEPAPPPPQEEPPRRPDPR